MQCHMDTLNIRIMLYLTKGVMLIGVQIIKYKIFQIENLITYNMGEMCLQRFPI